MTKDRSTLPIYIYNSIEDEWDFISSFTKKQQKKLIHDSNRFADCYLFANALLPSFILVAPINVSNAFKNYFELLSSTSCEIITPKEKTPFMCDNIYADKKIFTSIVERAKKEGSLTIYAYAITKKVFSLKRKFEKAGVSVYLPEAPDEKNLWTVAYFGSKSGFRKSFAPLMPPGTVVTNYKETRAIAGTLFSSSPDGIVLKTDKGNAGQGIHILRKSKIKTKKNLASEIARIYKNEPFLLRHPLIVEIYIDTSKEKKCPFPSVECFIHPNGEIEIPYYCNMIVTQAGEFYGMEINDTVFAKKIKHDVLEHTMQIAKKYREAGYRGRFDIDMICDGKKVYADESNTRINGGTDTYVISKKLVGNTFFSDRYILSSYMDLPSQVPHTFPAVYSICAPLLYDINTKCGLIINSESVIVNGGFSYILISKNKKESKMLHEQLKLLLTNYKKR